MNAYDLASEYLSRYRLYTDDLNATKNVELTRALHGLMKQRRASQWRHPSGLRYWTRPSTKPMSDVSLAKNLGFAIFCNRQVTNCPTAITKIELEQHLPQAKCQGLPGAHYLVQDGHRAKLGHARIDFSDTSLARIITKTRRVLRKYQARPGFSDVIEQGHFELTWVLESQSKCEQLARALEDVDVHPVELRIVVIPVLTSVCSPIHSSHSKSLRCNG